MPAFGPLSRREFIAAMRNLGWVGPYSGRGKHPEYMVKDGRQLKIPNPHRGDIGTHLLGKLLQEAGITREEWERG